jgi:hypothetical protein
MKSTIAVAIIISALAIGTATAPATADAKRICSKSGDREVCVGRDSAPKQEQPPAPWAKDGKKDDATPTPAPATAPAPTPASDAGTKPEPVWGSKECPNPTYPPWDRECGKRPPKGSANGGGNG